MANFGTCKTCDTKEANQVVDSVKSIFSVKFKVTPISKNGENWF